MKKSKKRVIPGFGLTMGVTITMLSIVVLIPLASLVIYSSQLGFNEFIEVITRKRILSSFYESFITALGASFVNAVMGLILACIRWQRLTRPSPTSDSNRRKKLWLEENIRWREPEILVSWLTSMLVRPL